MYCTEECRLITTSPTSYDVTLGDSHTFQCQSNRQITWRSDVPDSLLPYSGAIIINEVHQYHSGYYYCHATSSDCTQTVRFYVNVLHKWDVYTVSSNQFSEECETEHHINTPNVTEVKTGDGVTINCSVTGSPVPNVQWSRFIGSAYTNMGNASVAWSLLKLVSFKPTDAGQYICSASFLDVHTNWTIDIRVATGDGFPVWAIVIIVIAGAILLGVATHLLLIWLLFNSVKATETFGSKATLIMVGLLTVILLPGVGLVLVIVYYMYLVNITGSKPGLENGSDANRERQSSTASTSKIHPELGGKEVLQVSSSNGVKGGTIIPPTMSVMSAAPLAHSATLMQTHGGAPMAKLEPLNPTENTDGDGKPERKKKKKRKNKKRKHDGEGDNPDEGTEAATTRAMTPGDGDTSRLS